MDRAELEQMLNNMARSGASALHLMSDRPPCMRLNGKLVRSQSGAATSAELWKLAEAIVTPPQRARLAAGAEIDGLYTTESGLRFRQALVEDSGGLNLVFRSVPEGVPSLEELGLPELVGSFANYESGLVLVTGFLGSGKTMTTAAMIDRLNRTTASHVITIEEPIEFVHESDTSIIHQRGVGEQVRSFPVGIREAVRQGADVIMVSDLRDHNTFDAAIDAAERGCLVVASLDASCVVGALEQLLAKCPERDRDGMLRRLSTVLRAMISQALVRRGHGSGRVPLLEILIVNRAVKSAIQTRNFDGLTDIMERSYGLGMQTVDRGLRDLLDRNVITKEEALYRASDRELIQQR